MDCKHCGKGNGENVFCWHCGKRVNPTSAGFDKYGKEVINAYLVPACSKSGLYLVGDLGVGFVILNKNNKKLVIDSLFEDIITQGRKNFDSILVKKSGKWGLINPITGVIICDFIYDDISQVGEEDDNGDGEIVVYSNGLCGKIDCNGNIILPIIYDEISSFGRVKYHGLWGVVRNGEQIIPCEYIRLGGSASLDDFWEVQPSLYKNGKWGVINGNDGEIILEFEYDEIEFIEGDYYYIMRIGDKWGSKTDKFRFPCEFSLEEIKRATNAYFDNSQWTLYAENGRRIFLVAHGCEVICYTQVGNNKPQSKFLRLGYTEDEYPIVYSQRYGNNIFLVGDDVPELNIIGWKKGSFSIFKINVENFDLTYIDYGTAVHFEKDGFKVANDCSQHGVWFFRDSYYDLNGKKVRDDKYEYDFEDLKYRYGESLINAQKIVAQRLLHQE